MAVTLKDTGENFGMPFTGAGGSVIMGQACAINDCIVTYIQLLNATVNAPPTITDNVNTGPYTLVNGTAYLDAGNQILTAVYIKIANANGAAPTITCPNISSINASAGGRLGCFSFTGFAGVPSADAGVTGRNTGTVNPVTSIVLNTSANPEAMFLIESGTSGFVQGAGSGTWATIAGASGNGAMPWYNIISAVAPQLVTFSDTATTVTNWQATSSGFRVAPAGGGSGLVSGAGVSGSTVSNSGPTSARVSGAPVSKIVIP